MRAVVQDVHPPPAKTLISRCGLDKNSDPSHLDLSFNILDFRSKATEPPGQTAQKKKVDLLENPRRAMALGTHP